MTTLGWVAQARSVQDFNDLDQKDWVHEADPFDLHETKEAALEAAKGYVQTWAEQYRDDLTSVVVWWEDRKKLAGNGQWFEIVVDGEVVAEGRTLARKVRKV